MLPYLIAGVIGYGISKLFEDKKAPKYADGGLIAPNGKPSNLTPEQYKLVRTPAFKKWFGDWQNDPANASKVVDSNGEPLICYHTSNKKFTKFNYKLSYDGAIWFTENIQDIINNETGAGKTGVVYEVFLDIKKMGDWDDYDKGISELLRDKFNGAKMDDDYIVFESNQIKLADGTNTTFDGNNPDIRFNGGGKLADNIFEYKEDYYEPKKYGEVSYKFKNENEDEFNVSLTNINKKQKSLVLDFEGNYSWETMKNNNPFKTLRTLSTIVKYALKKLYNDGFIINTIIYDATEKKSKIYKLLIHKEFPNAKFKINQFGSDEVKLYGNNPDIRFMAGGNVYTNSFDKWFNNSKVVDKKGNPLIVYHGSPDLRGLKEKYIFESRFADNQSFFFTDNYSMAKSYADPKRAFDYQNAEEGVIRLYLSLQNPLIVNAFNQIWRKFETTIDGNEIIGTRNLIKFAKNKGYDGVIVENVRDYYNNNEKKTKGGNVYVAFEPTQIKIANGTNTTFDANNPDIRFDDGGVTDEYLKYFKENNIIVNNISDLGSGDYSKTYKIDTNKGEFALNIRSEMVGDYSSLIDEYYDYLPTIYDVRNINGKYCIVMEVLLPISTDEKNIIDCIDYLFYANDEDGLDVWLEDNLRYDLYLKVEELMGETDIDRISEKQYIDKLKWFYDNYGDYETFINDIQSAFQEYNEALGFNYVDFHGDNLMQDKYGQVKLIDL